MQNRVIFLNVSGITKGIFTLLNCYNLRHIISLCTFGRDMDVMILLPQSMLKPGKLWWNFLWFWFNFPSHPPLGNFFAVVEFQFALFNVKGCMLMGQRKFGLLKCLFFTRGKMQGEWYNYIYSSHGKNLFFHTFCVAYKVPVPKQLSFPKLLIFNTYWLANPSEITCVQCRS